MAEIKNHTLNFGFGRPLRGLDFAAAKSAFAEVERAPLSSDRVFHG
jgi:hypothetical protein